jgi:hypothetical protein
LSEAIRVARKNVSKGSAALRYKSAGDVREKKRERKRMRGENGQSFACQKVRKGNDRETVNVRRMERERERVTERKRERRNKERERERGKERARITGPPDSSHLHRVCPSAAGHRGRRKSGRRCRCRGGF